MQFAEAACGGAAVMLNGSIERPFDPSRSVPPPPTNLLRWWPLSHVRFAHFSVFGSVEVPRLSPAKIKKLTVVLATPTSPQ